MNSYQRLEINLLPPEMAPGPAIKLTTVFSVMLATIALLGIGAHALFSYMDIQKLEKDRADNQQKILQAKPIVDEYMALKDIKDNTEGRGKLVGMASATYVEYPVILDRVSRLLPPGVSLVRAASGGGGSATTANKEVLFEFRAANGDPELMNRTLEAFKASPMFSDAYLRVGDFRPRPLDELAGQFGIGYSYQNPGERDPAIAETYSFEIRTQVNTPLEIDDLPTVMDKSNLMTPFELTTNPDAAVAAATAPASAQPAGAASGAAATPAGDTPPAGAAPAAGGAN